MVPNISRVIRPVPQPKSGSYRMDWSQLVVFSIMPLTGRDAVAHVSEIHGVSQRRACKALAVERSTVQYRSVRPDDGQARAAMKAVAAERRRFGCRTKHVMLERQGIVMTLKKLRRLYREEKVQGLRRRPYPFLAHHSQNATERS